MIHNVEGWGKETANYAKGVFEDEGEDESALANGQFLGVVVRLGPFTVFLDQVH